MISGIFPRRLNGSPTGHRRAVRRFRVRVGHAVSHGIDSLPVLSAVVGKAHKPSVGIASEGAIQRSKTTNKNGASQAKRRYG